jgi:hypothetical protein
MITEVVSGRRLGHYLELQPRRKTTATETSIRYDIVRSFFSWRLVLYIQEVPASRGKRGHVIVGFTPEFFPVSLPVTPGLFQRIIN